MRTVQLGDGPATYTDQGAGPVLVAIHGLPGSVRDFRWLGSHLEAKIRLVRVNMPGFDGCPARQDRRVECRAEHVLRVADALGLERFSVLGHSMGGAIAAAVAARATHRVRSLSLLASIGLRPHAALRAAPHPAIVAYLATAPWSRQWVMPKVRDGFGRAGFPSSTPDDLWIETLRCVAALSFRTHRSHIKRLACPTLLAWADDDRLVEPSIAAELEHALPSGPRLHFPMGGHNIQKTRAAELGQALVQHLSG